jgi:hypothetical protein
MSATEHVDKKKTIYKSFNKCAKRLFKDLALLAPGNMTLKLALAGFSIFKGLGKKLPGNYFYDIVVIPHETHITDRYGFFLDSNFGTVGFSCLGEKINQVWATLPDHGKETIWKYLDELVILSKKCRHVTPNWTPE